MTLPQAYLTDRQLEIWKLRFKGLKQAEVGRRLGITRQGVYDAEKQMLFKVESALKHVAQVNRLDVDTIEPSKGILHGYHPATKNRVIVTFSATNGVQTWHYEDPDCDVCQWKDNCKQRLLDEADERDIHLSEIERDLPASKLAHTIFSKAIPGLET
jgi:transcriptional regulator